MSDMWVFSPSAENQLRQCLSVTSSTNQNKWSKEFGHLVKNNHKLISNLERKDINSNSQQNNAISSSILRSKTEDCITLTDTEDSHNENNQEIEQKESSFDIKQLEELLEQIETELVDNFEQISEKCINNIDLFINLAKQITFDAFEKLCSHIYNNPTTNNDFTSIFFQHFLPTFLKREYNCVVLDLLLKGNKIFPSEFKTFIMSITNVGDVPNKVLQDYVVSLDEKGKTEFLENISHLDLKSDLFVHHLFTIHLAYQDSMRTELIQDYIQTMLTQHATVCEKDKSYGRLLFAFLQSLKQSQQEMDYLKIEKIVDIHKSPFRRPCVNIVIELKSK